MKNITVKVILIEAHPQVWMPKMYIFQANFPKIEPQIKIHP